MQSNSGATRACWVLPRCWYKRWEDMRGSQRRGWRRGPNKTDGTQVQRSHIWISKVVLFFKSYATYSPYPHNISYFSIKKGHLITWPHGGSAANWRDSAVIFFPAKHKSNWANRNMKNALSWRQLLNLVIDMLCGVVGPQFLKNTAYINRKERKKSCVITQGRSE